MHKTLQMNSEGYEPLLKDGVIVLTSLVNVREEVHMTY